MNTQTIYEFPLNERIRVFMRLEQLFLHLEHFLVGKSIFDKRAAINVLLDILTICGRSDLKSEIIKELEKHTKILNQLSSKQHIDNHKLTAILSDFNQASNALHRTSMAIPPRLIATMLNG